MAKKDALEPAVQTAPATFTKAKLLECTKYRDRRDLLTALLKDDQPYTMAEVDTAIAAFMKGEVR